MVAALVALVATALLVAGCGGGQPAQIEAGNAGYHGTVVSPPLDVPSVRLTDHHGDPIDLTRDRQQLDLLFFGYTNCPDICQIVMGTIASAYARLSEEQQQRVRVAFVSTDPARDTPAQLRSYLARFNPEFTGVRGPLSRIQELARPLGIYFEKGQRLPSGGYAVDHDSHVVALTGSDAPLLWSGTVSPADLAADVQRLLEDGPPGKKHSQEDSA